MSWIMEILVEILGEAILEGWMALMQLCIPGNMSVKRQRIVRIVVKCFTWILFIAAFLGVILWVDPISEIGEKTGMYIFLIAMGISVLQIVIGCIVHFKPKR